MEVVDDAVHRLLRNAVENFHVTDELLHDVLVDLLAKTL